MSLGSDSQKKSPVKKGANISLEFSDFLFLQVLRAADCIVHYPICMLARTVATKVINTPEDEA